MKYFTFSCCFWSILICNWNGLFQILITLVPPRFLTITSSNFNYLINQSRTVRLKCAGTPSCITVHLLTKAPFPAVVGKYLTGNRCRLCVITTLWQDMWTSQTATSSINPHVNAKLLLVYNVYCTTCILLCH